MTKIHLKDPTVPPDNFHHTLGQRVCRKDEHDMPSPSTCGVIVDGVRYEQEGGGSYDEIYMVELDSGGTVNFKLIEITDEG